VNKKLDTYPLEKIIGFWYGKIHISLFVYLFCWLIIAFLILLVIRSIVGVFGYWDDVKALNMLIASMSFAFPLAIIVEGTVLWDFKNKRSKCKVCFARKMYYRYHGIEEERTIEQESTPERRKFYYDKYSRSACEKCESIYYKKARGLEL